VLNPLLALASALLLILSFPRFDLAWLMSIALTPLLIAAGREDRPLRRFLLGWITGAGCIAGITDWIRFVVTVHGNLGPAAGWGVFFLFCLAKGLYFGGFALLVRPFLRVWWSVPAVAALWVAVDKILGGAGYVWVTLGNAAADMSIPMRLAPITGVHGLSFVFMMMAASLALVALRRPRRQLLWLLALPLLILLPPLPEPQTGTQRAAVVQPNVDDATQWTREVLDQFLQRMLLASMQVVIQGGKQQTDLIVWPEMPAPIYYEKDAAFQQQAGSMARVTRAAFLFGTVAHTRTGDPLNSAQLLDARGEPVSRYDKIHLVPFGEYVPWPFRFAGKITSEVGDFVPGSRVVVSEAGGHKLASFICYESAFAGLAREMTAQGAQVLFNLSNDGYFGRSPSARGQHLLLVRMRAAENARWILRATNDGVTAAVDPAGRVVETLPQFRMTAASLPFSYSTSQTFYTRHGDWFAWLCTGLVTVAGIRLPRRNG
jgi:apolipoprotein N-acyltransferase